MFIDENFISITKYDISSWDEITLKIIKFINVYLEGDNKILSDGYQKKDLTIEGNERNLYIVNRQASWFRNQKIFLKKNMDNFKKVDEIVKKENSKLGIINY